MLYTIHALNTLCLELDDYVSNAKFWAAASKRDDGGYENERLCHDYVTKALTLIGAIQTMAQVCYDYYDENDDEDEMDLVIRIRRFVTAKKSEVEEYAE